MKKIRSALSICLLLALTACSAGINSSGMPEDFSVDETDLYLSRGSMHSVDFEKYSLTPGRLYQQCGVIRNKKHLSTHQQLFDLNENEYDELMQLVWNVLDLSYKGEAELGSPSQGDTMFDTGKLFLNINGNQNTLKIKTSVDEVTQPESEIAENLNALSRTIRGKAKPGACGNPSYYGLGYN